MGHRYFAAQPITSGHAVVTGPEAHHLLHVMRAAVGDELTLFDGSGSEFTGRIERVKRSQVHVAVTSRKEISREDARQIILGTALPKGNRQRWFVEKLTELGAARLVPLRSERTVVHPTAGTLKRLERFVVEACKQCGRNQLMEIAPLTTFKDFVALAPTSALKWIAAFEGTPVSREPFARTVACLAVGPEGGFTPEEREAALAAGWQAVSLGPRILRVETAGAVLATLASSDLHHT